MNNNDIHIRLNDAYIKQIKQQAKLRRMTLSEYIRQAIFKELDEKVLAEICVVPVTLKDTEYVSLDIAASGKDKSIEAYCHELIMENF